MPTSSTKLSVRAAALDADVRQSSTIAGRIGFRGIQLDTRSPSLDMAELSASGVRDLRHQIAREDLTLESVRAQVPADLITQAASVDRLVWGLDRAVQTSAALGAGVLCVDIGRLPAARAESAASRPVAPQSAGLLILPEPIATPAAPLEPVADDPAWPAIDEVMRELGARADRYRVIVAFSSELSSYASLKRLLDGARCPWFGLDLDTVSVLRDAWDLEHVLDGLGSALRHVCARDAVKGAGGRTQPAAFGQGSVNWEQLLAALDEGGFAGWLMVDPSDLPDRAGEARNAIKTLLEFQNR